MAEITPGAGRAAVTGKKAKEQPGAVQRKKYLKKRGSGLVATGQVIIPLGTCPSGAQWFIERIMLFCTSTTTTTFALYEDDVDPMYLLEETTDGNDNVADEASPPVVSGGSAIVAVWSNVNAVDGFGNPSKASIVVQIREEA